MKKLVHLALAGLLLSHLAGCRPAANPSQKERVASVMAKADSLMRTRPDSALKLLYSIAPASPSGGGGYYYFLLLLDAQNKCDTVFRTDTLQRTLVKHFDRHGTPNERMRAHYLLGRAHHDMGDVPRALDSYLTAISVADTTSADCDYYHLCRVYGQMATIFHQQFLPEDEMLATKQSERYAWLAKDTLEALVAYELRISPYYLQNKMDSVLHITETARKRYRAFGYNHKSARALFTAISIFLDRHQYDKAHEYMECYEKESGLFDNQGNIAQGGELYYYYKGVYMQATHQSDSALYYYRKVLDTGNDETAYKGLLSFFEATKNTDSIVKYARLFTNANDTALLNYQRHTLRQTSAISSFSHYQHEKEKAERRHVQDQNTILLVSLLSVVSMAAGYFLFRWNRENSRKRIALLTQRHKTLKSKLFQASKELESLGSKNMATEKQLSEKTKEIEELQQLIAQQQSSIQNHSYSKLIDSFRQTGIYQLFRKLREYKIDNQTPTDDEWQQLIETFFHHFPHYYKRLAVDASLRQQQLRVCILLILQFKTDEIAILTSKSKQQIVQTKQQINRKVFSQEDAATLKQNLSNMANNI